MLKVFLIAIGFIAASYIYWQYKTMMKYEDLLGNRVTTLHRLAREGELETLKNYLYSDDFDKQKIDKLDINGATPLAYAIGREQDSLEAINLLIDFGADIRLEPGEEMFGEFSGSPLNVAIKQLNLPVIQVLNALGVDLHQIKKENYNTAITLAYASIDKSLDSLLPVIDYFIEQKVSFYQKTKYNESPVNTFYRHKHFGVLAHLQNKKIDLSELNLSPLMQAILFEDVNAVEKHLKDYQHKGTVEAELSHRAHWRRTPLILAILHGSIEKACLLLDFGADLNVQGRFKQTLPFYAINSNNPGMLSWLLDKHNYDLDIQNELKNNLLDEAVSNNKIEATRALLKKGISVDQENEYGFTVLHDVESAQMAELLLEHGANPKDLTHETKRQLLGMPAEATDEYMLLSHQDYLAGRYVEYGKDNPTRIEDRFKLTMIESGEGPWRVTKFFDPDRDISNGRPIWNVQRFGQSFTRISDGRVIEIGGEHEDSYDPDFQIYNDVIVHDGKGKAELYVYPEDVFPPTDFHSATLVGDKIYIIGSLGYDRKTGTTPVYTLDINDYHIEKVQTSGTMPGWIYEHKAVLTGRSQISISGGSIYSDLNQGEIKNEAVYRFNLTTHHWSKVE